MTTENTEKLNPHSKRKKYSDHGGLTSTEIRKVFRYEYHAGNLVRKNTGRRVKSNLVKIGEVKVSASHIVWILYTGSWPNGFIRHLDGNRQNCKIENLREIVSKRKPPIIMPLFSEIGYASDLDSEPKPMAMAADDLSEDYDDGCDLDLDQFDFESESEIAPHGTANRRQAINLNYVIDTTEFGFTEADEARSDDEFLF